ncbi:hypothetical protein [Tabrizicola sp. M-4]|uniref:hypothetical protein n=1 Tax=Tabrizicola sp. M-4 TaxID=3055847 RepID=UPI003DA8BBC5
MTDQTEVQRRFAEWQEAHSRANDRGLDYEEVERLSDIAEALGATLCEVPSQTHADVALKLCAFSNFGEWGLPTVTDAPLFWAEVEAMRRGQPLPIMEAAR